MFTSTVGRVKGEVTRCWLFEAGVTLGAGQMLTEGEHLALFTVGAHKVYTRHTFGHLESGLQRICEPTFNIITTYETVHNDVNCVILVSRQLFIGLKKFTDIPHRAVDARAYETLTRDVGKQCVVFAFASTYNRGENLKACALLQLHDAVNNLLWGLTLEGYSVRWTMLDTNARVQQSQVVINLCDSSHSGARISRCRFLIDGDCGRQPFNHIDIRLIHLSQELTCIRRQALYVTTLPFCINGVKSKRTFTTARQPSKDDELVARKLKTYVLQIVFSSASNNDFF
ncbi:unannotated protein [freshwater metagenome]|uniref:Unannotated protein n=1 Tax=freshwater metagenome TaxID=449393 RepID=A0A6J6ENK7_9ZZZZ